MDFLIVLLFIVMVLAPCLVALWGSSHAEEEHVFTPQSNHILHPTAQEHAAQGIAFVTEPKPAQPFRALSAASRFVARQVKKAGAALAAPRLQADEAEPLEPEPKSASTSRQAWSGQVQSRKLQSATASLEDLLSMAIESAHIARAASLRADAAASAAAARMAAIRAEAAADDARVAQHHANAVEHAALAAQAAYEYAHFQANQSLGQPSDEPEEPTPSVRLISDRRAA